MYKKSEEKEPVPFNPDPSYQKSILLRRVTKKYLQMIKIIKNFRLHVNGLCLWIDFNKVFNKS